MILKKVIPHLPIIIKSFRYGVLEYWSVECCKNKFTFDIPPILQHSNTPAIKANG
jgi:hypothetical protein